MASKLNLDLLQDREDIIEYIYHLYRYNDARVNSEEKNSTMQKDVDTLLKLQEIKRK